MASINYHTREISCKIVYYGPGLSGKTTNLQIIHKKVPKDSKSEMVSLATETDRTLFFDFLPLDLGSIKGFSTKFQLYTVPGQVYYNATRKLVLRGVDGVVFVADSQRDKMPENLESLRNLEENLREYGIELKTTPFILQYNKRDLPSIFTVDEMHAQINAYGVPAFEAQAHQGVGVFTTLKAIGKIVIDTFNTKYSARQSSRRPDPTPSSIGSIPAVPAAPSLAPAPIAAIPVPPPPAPSLQMPPQQPPQPASGFSAPAARPMVPPAPLPRQQPAPQGYAPAPTPIQGYAPPPAVPFQPPAPQGLAQPPAAPSPVGAPPAFQNFVPPPAIPSQSQPNAMGAAQGFSPPPAIQPQGFASPTAAQGFAPPPVAQPQGFVPVQAVAPQAPAPIQGFSPPVASPSQVPASAQTVGLQAALISDYGMDNPIARPVPPQAPIVTDSFAPPAQPPAAVPAPGLQSGFFQPTPPAPISPPLGTNSPQRKERLDGTMDPRDLDAEIARMEREILGQPQAAPPQPLPQPPVAAKPVGIQTNPNVNPNMDTDPAFSDAFLSLDEIRQFQQSPQDYPTQRLPMNPGNANP
ncbi:MAG: hypothetical protein RL318_2955 [Fibrobacterota bacterium]|jgi:signal recognition particle receptor subunit beta